MYYHGYVGVCSNEHFLIAFTIVIFYAIHNPQHKIVLHIFLIGILVTIVLFVLDRIAEPVQQTSFSGSMIPAALTIITINY